MYADLHIHTKYSSGIDDPRTIFEYAKRYGISTIAITDQNSVEGVREAIKHSKDFDVRLITGIELTSTHESKTVHILGYHIDINSTSIKDYINNKATETTETTRLNFDNAIKKGVFSFSWERVLELNPNSSEITGMQVIYAMNKDNYKSPKNINNWEIYRQYLHKDGKYYIKKQIKTPYDAILAIKKSGGIPVLAHPNRIGSFKEMTKFIAQGILGLEVYHPSHTEEETKNYLTFAKDNNLFVTGGSGWHGQVSDKGVSQFGLCGLEHGDYGILKLQNDGFSSVSFPTF